MKKGSIAALLVFIVIILASCGKNEITINVINDQTSPAPVSSMSAQLKTKVIYDVDGEQTEVDAILHQDTPTIPDPVKENYVFAGWLKQGAKVTGIDPTVEAANIIYVATWKGEAPTTKVVVTEAPTTAAPVTEAPTTESPMTEAPATESPDTEPPTEAPTEPPTTPARVDVHVGQIVTFGHYEQDNNLNNGAEPIEWMVMGVFDDYVDLISLYVLDVTPFNNASKPVTYSGSSVNAYLNDTFFRAAFSEEDRPYMMTHNIPPRSNPEYPGTDQGLEVTEYVFLSAIGKVTEFLPADVARRCAGTPYAVARGLHVNEMGFSPWWTRTMGEDNYHAVIVRSSGEVFYEGWDVTGADYFDIGIRPAIRVLPYAPLGE